jgi:hypothetical protein
MLLLLPLLLVCCLCLLLQQRDHEEFVVRLKDVVPDKQQLLQDLQENAARHFDLQVRCWGPVREQQLPAARRLQLEACRDSTKQLSQTDCGVQGARLLHVCNVRVH